MRAYPRGNAVVFQVIERAISEKCEKPLGMRVERRCYVRGACACIDGLYLGGRSLRQIKIDSGGEFVPKEKAYN